MNRIFRLVWNHRLNALVVVSEIATSRGSLIAGPVVVHLKVPLKLLALGLACALGSGSALAADNQTLSDLQALTDKYLPVQVEAELGLQALLPATSAAAPTSPLADVAAHVQVGLGRTHPPAAALRVNVDAGRSPAQPVTAAVHVPVAVTLPDVVALEASADATVDAGAALRASVSAGLAGPVDAQATQAQVQVADRNDKLVTADVSAQASALQSNRDGVLVGLLGASATWRRLSAEWSRMSAAPWPAPDCWVTLVPAWVARSATWAAWWVQWAVAWGAAWSTRCRRAARRHRQRATRMRV